MSGHSARIDSPDVLRDFRVQYVKFDEVSRIAVADLRGDVQRILSWLQHEQSSYWKSELRKAEELILQAKNAYNLARYGAQSYRKTSYVDEERTLRRAVARKETAEKKLEAIKRWTRTVEQQCEKLIGPVTSFGSLLEAQTPMALARLDFLSRQLEAYLRDSGPAS